MANNNILEDMFDVLTGSIFEGPKTITKEGVSNESKREAGHNINISVGSLYKKQKRGTDSAPDSEEKGKTTGKQESTED